MGLKQQRKTDEIVTTDMQISWNGNRVKWPVLKFRLRGPCKLFSGHWSLSHVKHKQLKYHKTKHRIIIRRCTWLYSTPKFCCLSSIFFFQVNLLYFSLSAGLLLNRVIQKYGRWRCCIVWLGWLYGTNCTCLQFIDD